MSSNIYEFNPDNADSWFTKLPAKDQQKLFDSITRMNKVSEWVKRANALPAEYHGIAERMTTNVSASLTDEQVYALDSQLIKTVYDTDIFAQIMGGAGITKSSNSWMSKNYKVNETNIPYPALSRDFRDPPVFKLGVEPEGFKGMGCAIAYEIPWTEIAEAKGGVYDPDFYHALVASERMGRTLDGMGWYGGASAYATAGNADSGIKGILNDASIQTFTGTGLTTRLGLRTALFEACQDLAKVYQPGKQILVTTKGIYEEAVMLLAGYYTEATEFSIIKRDLFDTGIIDEWWVTDKIYNSLSDPSVSQQQMALMKIGPMLQKNQVVYPLQTKPMATKEYPDDIREALLYGNVFCQYGVAVHPVTLSADLTTTGTGISRAGRVI
jgi:hypothetical protein